MSASSMLPNVTMLHNAFVPPLRNEVIIHDVMTTPHDEVITPSDGFTTPRDGLTTSSVGFTTPPAKVYNGIPPRAPKTSRVPQSSVIENYTYIPSLHQMPSIPMPLFLDHEDMLHVHTSANTSSAYPIDIINTIYRVDNFQYNIVHPSVEISSSNLDSKNDTETEI